MFAEKKVYFFSSQKTNQVYLKNLYIHSCQN